MPTPTPHQQAIIEAIAQRSGPSVEVAAGAGCAKSSTLEMAAPGIRVPALALAFNKKIATELKSRLPSNFSPMTLNGLGHRAWMRKLGPGVKIEIDDRKVGKIASEVAKDHGVELQSDQWDGLRQMISKAQQVGLVPEGEQRLGLVPDDEDSWREVGYLAGVYSDEFDLLWPLAREGLVRDIALARQGIISFDDQVYCPTLLGGPFPKFPVVFVDEAQDLSTLNHKMLAACVASDGRLVQVGDERQAIYAFRGADGQSMRSIRALRQQWSRLELPVTFRCPKAVVARQLEHYPNFQAWPANPEGRVLTIGRPTLEHPDGGWSWADIERALPHERATVAILCRNNGPIMSIAFKLIRRGIGVVMLGRDIGKGLVVLSRKLAPEDGASPDAITAAILEWEDRECSLARANGREERCAGITDRAECLRAVLDSGVRNAGELRVALEKLFARDSGRVTLGSIHRMKGLEYDLVIHLDPWRIPSRQAREAMAQGDPGSMQQERNLKYVAETRTKHTLVMASLEAFQ